jgi:pSer/pThr/pTyr-binding forkhead associated (FHA) protein
MLLRQRDTNASWDLREGLRIGRLSENDIVLADASVSRLHAQVESRGGTFWLCDLRSSNGIQLNGRRAQEFPLRPGDLVTVGSLAFDVEGEVVAAPAPKREDVSNSEALPSFSKVSDREREEIRAELRQRQTSKGFGDLSQQPFAMRVAVYLGALGFLAAIVMGVRWLSNSI